MIRNSHGRASAWITLLTVGLWNLSVTQAETRNYPGPAPCNSTLQACVDGAQRDDIIEIATNDNIDETVGLRIGMTLRAADGFSPTIGGSANFRTIRLSSLFGTAGISESVVVSGLSFENASINFGIAEGAGHRLVVRNNVFRNESRSAIDLDGRVPGEFLVEGNDIVSVRDSISLFGQLNSGELIATIQGNRVTTSVPEESYSGIDLDLRGLNTYTINLYSNLIYGVAGCDCGGATGIKLRVSDTPDVRLAVTNNTVHGIDTDDGIRLSAPSSPGTLILSLYNNNVSYSRNNAFQLSNVSATNVLLSADGNNAFQNGGTGNFGGLDAGTITELDPRYYNETNGDFRLLNSSPLINAGVNEPFGGLSEIDANGAARVVDGRVDVGAFEYASVSPQLILDRARFLQLTDPSVVTAPYTPVNQPPEPYIRGDISFDAIAPSSLYFANWPADFDGDNDIELAISGNEDLNITNIETPVFAMGIDFDDLTGGTDPSTFRLTLLNGDNLVGTVNFETPAATVWDFIGIWSPDPFDTIQIRETSTANGNEYFGPVWASQVRLDDTYILRDSFE